eukprot:3730-Heterococcus_DN1.PRE.1
MACTSRWTRCAGATHAAGAGACRVPQSKQRRRSHQCYALIYIFTPARRTVCYLNLAVGYHYLYRSAMHACCSVEHVVSGTGIGTTYEFLAYKHPDRVDPAVHAQIQAAALSHRARVITDPAHTILLPRSGPRSSINATAFITVYTHYHITTAWQSV